MSFESCPSSQPIRGHHPFLGGSQKHDFPEGLLVEHDVIPEQVWDILQSWLENDRFPYEKSPIPWEIGAQNRRVAQFGFRYNYNTSVVEFADEVPEIPRTLQKLLLESCGKNLGGLQADPTSFTQCIINIYREKDIIPWHWDHVDFGPVVLVFTFGEDRPLQLRRLKDSCRPSLELPSSQCHHEEGDFADNDYDYYTVHPRHRSSYVLSGPARYEWEHSVPPGNGYRVSITFRTHSKDYKDPPK